MGIDLGLISKLSMLLGIFFTVIGLASTNSFNYSDQATIFLVIGGVFFIVAFVTLFPISKHASRQEKIFVVTGVLSIILMVSAVIVYTIVSIRTEIIPVIIRGPSRTPATEALRVQLIPEHIYASTSLTLMVIGLMLLLYSFYLKAKFL
jgi:hypothetical protein